MEMPRLIDFIGRRDGMTSSRGEEKKAPVFCHDALGKGTRPAILFTQAPHKRPLRARWIDLHRFEPTEQCFLLSA